MRFRRFRRWARRYIYPPSGIEVRRLIAFLTLAVGIPRLPELHEILTFAPQRFGEPEMFGVACVVIGALLMATCYRQRVGVFGRLVAALGFVLWVTLAAATTSATSLLIDLAVAASLLTEIVTTRHE